MQVLESVNGQPAVIRRRNKKFHAGFTLLDPFGRVAPQALGELGTDRDDPIFLSLALPDEDRKVVKINVAVFEV